ncbi:SMC-Scp complex subunit ScpB [Novipirellula artificiosorum]|uniref:Segregation and condensation protein B n=1 Tax=Novipirellula artificiosorum TaxID=2528016 RepID=A0A5C6E0E2_9BACT|nr:SMC-Scp complex subunit ScpB [Novipirellula artificiosorum]TWU40806.1 hypothetical protein Poly41_16410 [Novipirellula artificiosorum]
MKPSGSFVPIGSRSLTAMGPTQVSQFGWQNSTSAWRSKPPRRPYGVLSGHNEPSTDIPADAEPTSGDDPQKKRKRVEAVLFLAKVPLSPRKLSQLAHLADATEARTLVRELNTSYESHGRAIRVEQIAGGYRMMTRVALSPWLIRLGHLPPAVRLSTPMMETLAVVAYRQNVSRADVEAIRGVACGELLRQLMERDLVRIAGRSEELGRPYLYGTTKHFLHVFGLASTEGLPPIQWQMLRETLNDPASDERSETTPEDLSPNDSFPSKKESVVSTAVASVLSEPQSDLWIVDPVLESPRGYEGHPQQEDPRAVIEDEEDELYGDDDDDDDDLVDDDEDDDDDWDDDDDDDLDEEDDEDDLDKEDLDEEDVDDDLEGDDEEDVDDDWEEVDDDDDDDWDDDDDDEDDDWEEDAADDDEDWT